MIVKALIKDKLEDFSRNWKNLNLGLRIFFLLITIPLSIIALSEATEFLIPQAKPMYGVSFSVKYAEELGLNWKSTFTSMTKEIPVNRLRLMSYWDMIEPRQNEYDFSDLDWQMNKAQEANIKVTLAIGRRQPRWPECHEPNWVAQKINYNEDWQSDLFDYLTKVVERYKDHPALDSYQLENESRNSNFGICGGEAPIELLEKEFNLVKNIDTNTPVYMSVSDQNGVPIKNPTPDAYGLSVYRRVWNGVTPIKFYMDYPTPVWFQILRKNIITIVKDRPVFVHELQMEPWGPYPTHRLTLEEQDKSMSTEQMIDNLKFAKRIGVNQIDMWGIEWWYWREKNFNDSEPLKVIKNELMNNSK